ncbi:hypothetical protein QTP88_017014 [Uroleucon formosanum]
MTPTSRSERRHAIDPDATYVIRANAHRRFQKQSGPLVGNRTRGIEKPKFLMGTTTRRTRRANGLKKTKTKVQVTEAGPVSPSDDRSTRTPRRPLECSAPTVQLAIQSAVANRW